MWFDATKTSEALTGGSLHQGDQRAPHELGVVQLAHCLACLREELGIHLDGPSHGSSDDRPLDSHMMTHPQSRTMGRQGT